MLGFRRKNKKDDNSTLAQGLAALNRFEYETALELLETARDEEPDNPEAAYAHGRALFEDTRFDQAQEIFQDLLERFPEHESGYMGMAKLDMESGRLDNAAQLVETALEHNPASAEAWTLHGKILRLKSYMTDAIDAVEQALRVDRNYAPAYLERANIAMQQRDMNTARQYYSRAMDLSPDDPVGFVLAAAMENLMGNPDASLNLAEQALVIHPRNVAAMGQKARLLCAMGQQEEGIALLNESMEMAPKRESTHFFLAEYYSQSNQMDKARQAFHTVAELNPANGLAYYNAAKITKHTERDEFINSMEARLQDLPEQAWLPRMQISFALSKALEDIGEYDAAFGHMQVGNDLVWDNALNYDQEQAAWEFEAVKELFSPERITEFAGTGPDDSTPIFVVGMPRSGSTLIDHILDSHPKIASIGESNLLQVVIEHHLQQVGLAGVDEESLPHLCSVVGPSYVEELKALTDNAPSVVNKALGNFMEIGLIASCMPGARIVHSRRNALDTCISCWKNLLDVNQPYIYNLEALGRYHLLYQDIMAHWDQVLPGKVLHVDYEKLVADPEPEIRTLLDALGEEFAPACLEFHKSKRQVRTASLAQVRQPMYTSSVASWKRYEQHLRPLLDLLGETG